MNQNVFVFENMERAKFSPYEYGYSAVLWATESAVNVIKAIADHAAMDKPLFRLIKQNTGIGEAELTAAIIATYVVYGVIVLRAPQHVLDDIDKGVTNSINENLSKGNGDLIHKTWRGYVGVLNAELESEPEDPDVVRPSPSATAEKIFERIKGYYAFTQKENKEIEVLPLDRAYMESLISEVTIKYINVLFDVHKVRYLS